MLPMIRLDNNSIINISTPDDTIFLDTNHITADPPNLPLCANTEMKCGGHPETLRYGDWGAEANIVAFFIAASWRSS